MKATQFTYLWIVTWTLVFAGSVSGLEGTVLTGKVTDVRSGEPIAGASVSIPGKGLGTETDADGWFVLGPLESGVVVVEISRVGYRELVRKTVFLVGEDRVVLDLTLTPEAIPLEEIQVVAQPVGAADLHRMPAFVTVLSRKDFEGRATSVPEVLSSSAGVQVKRLGGLGSFSTISIRGSSSEQVEVYLDGIPLNSAVGGGVDLGNLPLSQVEQIEVYRGAAASGGAMGGTVHLRTRSAKDGVRQSGSGSWGSLDTRGLNVLLSGDRDQTEYLVMADYSSSDNNFRFLDDNGTEYNKNDDVLSHRQNGDFVSSGLLGKWAHRTRGNLQVSVNQNLFWKHQGLPGISNNQSKEARLNLFRSLTELMLEAPGFLGRFSMRQTLFFSHKAESFIDREGEVGVGREDNRYQTRSTGWRGRGQTVLGLNHSAALETSVRRESYLPKAYLQQVQQFESDRWIVAGRAGADWLLPGRRGIFSSSASVEHQRSHTYEESPFKFSTLAPDTTTGRTLVNLRAGLRLDISPGVFLKANLGRSRRAPGFYELFGDRGGVIGNTDLVPERGVTWDAGFRAQWEEPDVLVEAAYFDQRYTDLIQFVQFSQGVGRAQNIGKARVRGVETMASTRWFGRWELSGNYTFQRAIDDSDVPHQRGKVLPNRAQHEVHVHSGLTAGSWLGFYDYTFDGGNFLDRANLRPVPSRHIHNLGLRRRLGRAVDVTLETRNLLDNQVADQWGYPLPGRSYFVTVQERF